METLEINKNFWKNKRVFVTGHTGFKGSWLCSYLIFLGANVTGYSLKPEKNSLFNDLNLSGKMTSIIGNIQDKKKLKKSLQSSKSKIIFHLAAQPIVSESYLNPYETYNTNIIGTINLLECIKELKNIRSVVIVTTDKVYENKEKKTGYKEDDKLGGFDPYSASKSSVEIISHSYYNSFFKKKLITNISTARSGNVIGGGDWSKNRIIPDLFKSINGRKKFTLRNPKSVRPWLHVLEPCNGYLKLAAKLYLSNKFNSSWNFGPTKSQSRNVEWIVNQSLNILNVNKNIYKTKQSNFHETKILMLNSSKSKKYLHWTPKLNIQKSLFLTLDWYVKKSKNTFQMWEYTINQIKYYQDIK